MKTGRAEEIVHALDMEKHPEGGWFSEVYTAPFAEQKAAGQSRAFAGSIYYLLERAAISRFHEIDCDELWYYHEGAGMRLYVLKADGSSETLLLGCDFSAGELPMVKLAAGDIFAAENLTSDGYTLISCMTTPKFSYAGWRLAGQAELLAKYPMQQAWIQKFAVESK